MAPPTRLYPTIKLDNLGMLPLKRSEFRPVPGPLFPPLRYIVFESCVTHLVVKKGLKPLAEIRVIKLLRDDDRLPLPATGGQDPPLSPRAPAYHVPIEIGLISKELCAHLTPHRCQHFITRSMPPHSRRSRNFGQRLGRGKKSGYCVSELFENTLPRRRTNGFCLARQDTTK